MGKLHSKLHSWGNGRWAIPMISGLLIVASFVVAEVFGSDGVGNIFMAAAAVVAGTPIVIKAARALTARVVGIDLLVSVATIGALIIGQYWEAAAVTFLFGIGHALEAATLNKTRSALAELVAVAPDVAVVMRDGLQVEVPAAGVVMGETVLVKNGAKVPVDGEVFAGTVSTGGFLQVKATGVGADTTLARIIHRVEEAQDAKAITQQFMDRFSAWYTPAIMVLALVVGLVSGDVVLAL